MSKFDCFHPNGLASAPHPTLCTLISCAADYNLAIAVWNNMITPAANKTWGWEPGTEPLCAQQDTLLYTD